MSAETSAVMWAKKLATAIDEDDWEFVFVCRGRMRTLLADALIDDNFNVIQIINYALNNAASRLVFNRNADLTLNSTSVYWGIQADQEFALEAEQIRPKPKTELSPKAAEGNKVFIEYKDELCPKDIRSEAKNH